MGDLSRHFNRVEFRCHCGCGFDAVSLRLVARLEALRDRLDSPVYILSGCRCPSHNKRVGGAVNSQHLRGTAADIVVPGSRPDQVAAAAETILGGSGGIGRYPTFTHVDVRRNGPARWIG